MYTPRNPYTPKQGEVFTPVQYLERTLSFYKWEKAKEISHLSTCRLESHKVLLLGGMCCIDYLKAIIDNTLFELAGCRTGIWVEPKNFRVWLTYAWKRLEELEDGHDYFDLWSTTLAKENSNIYRWSDETNISDRPGFTDHSFSRISQKYDYYDADPNVLLEIF